ncbi:MAG: VOC family protein [Xanthobacteraceae bacterium]
MAQRFFRLPALQPRPSHGEFLRDGTTSIHHIAFEVRDWSDIKRACDLLARNDIKLTWGPIRHIIGHNIAVYHNNPDGVVIEFFCDMDQMFDEELGFFEPRPWHQDRPQRPKVWGDDTPSNWWGPMSRSAAHGDPSAPKTTSEPSRQAAPAARAPALARARARRAEKKSRGTTKSRR